ncbi:uncharacterized protein LOC130763922 [Actinidia eriantha]|uniref:uncharacterized protein LOC130763922 n=1 Tax=Actinidia eriantha TaxID=165200 RepID=UPI00258926E0|nr:uncharacterized protein LOC130763922 [Actinidia eriantha]
MPEYTSSADKVAANNDLLTEILIRLPLCLWPIIARVLDGWTSIVPEPDFIPFINEGNPTDDGRSRSLTFFPGLSGHCGNDPNPSYLVLVPTTKQFKLLPELLFTDSEGLSLAFDPSRSPDYKVVRVLTTWTRVSPLQSVCYYRIEIYSTETGSWRASGEPFTIENDNNNMQFHTGVYWNGAINWFSTWGKFHILQCRRAPWNYANASSPRVSGF